MSKYEIIVRQAGLIAELQASLQATLSKIAALKAHLSQKSGNSNRPPSSDGLTKKPESITNTFLLAVGLKNL
ncbi:DUF6444 domain-containing protein [Tunicatimonas pelagia]|uniref:DUF6444 domain-containing protein n=1 Tax=Tunicatimonas pelagia TaxID=931531 RepID=UPI002665A34F|nr:DUF6444 domain-containing protein [Tunicatimonas pelagia]WKN46247.1 DUF6444 domain-containing protein [Tunicatimonas pelagia]